MTDIVFDMLDKNHDGVLTRDELRAGLKSHVINSGAVV